MPTTEASWLTAPPAAQAAPGGFQGRPVRMWPRNHSVTARMAAKAEAPASPLPLTVRQTTAARPHNSASPPARPATANGACQPWAATSTMKASEIHHRLTVK